MGKLSTCYRCGKGLAEATSTKQVDEDVDSYCQHCRIYYGDGLPVYLVKEDGVIVDLRGGE